MGLLKAIGATTRPISAGVFSLVFEILNGLNSLSALEGTRGAELSENLGPPTPGGGGNGNCNSDERGQHVYAIFERSKGITKKVGIAGNNRPNKARTRSQRALEQIRARGGEALYGHVVLLEIPTGYFNRFLAKQVEAAMVKAITAFFGYDLDPNWHSEPGPDDWPLECKSL